MNKTLTIIFEEDISDNEVQYFINSLSKTKGIKSMITDTTNINEVKEDDTQKKLIGIFKKEN